MLDPDRYDEVAEAFDGYSERTGFPITECLMEMTRLSRGDRLLDVACGSGIVTRRAAASVGETRKAVGVDLSPKQIRVAGQRAREAAYHWAEFAVMDAMELAVADESFDVVVAQCPHLPDRERCLGEMFRSPFDTAEEAFEWESIRTSSFRMRTDLDPARVAAFRQEYLREAQERLDQHGILGLTTGALFGVATKRRASA